MIIFKMGEKYKSSEVTIRQALKEDMAAVAEMIQELANFEKMPDGPKLTVKDLERDGFERQPPVFLCKVAELTTAQGRVVVGYALYFPTYSTWEGPAIMLEDLYVRTAERRKGIGQKLFKAVAKEAYSTGCSRLDFHVLEWNPARAFYEACGARDLTRAERWSCFRLAGAELAALAGMQS